MPIYQISDQKSVSVIKPVSFVSEKELQRLFEANLEVLLGVRFIASEFTTGDRQRGRIDTLGLDQDGFPTIIEYKKFSKENVINQGLFYLDWLVDHKGDFTVAAQQKCGPDIKIYWQHPRLIVIAESFSEYDKYAVNRIGANIELWTYRRYGDNLLYLEPIYVPTTPKSAVKPKEELSQLDRPEVDTDEPTYTIEGHLRGKSAMVKELFETVRENILGLGEDDSITEKANKHYIGYKHGKNFTEINVQTSGLKLWLDIAFSDLDDPHGLARDVSKIGHHGTGDVEVKLTDMKSVNKVMALIEQAYQQTL
jgi:predicted transport protein